MDRDETYFTFGGVSRVPLEPFKVGECIGGCYQLLRLLGRGGMSYVFEAEDALLSRRVAIKVVDDPELGASMLVREAKALAAVRHAGLPVIHGLGIHRGWTYLVIERLFGVTLEEHLDASSGRPMSLAEALPVLTSIADILAAVHGAGMAHRDLKPGNIMLTRGNRTVLLDFGIVLPEVDAADMPRCGTPRYLAPEAIRGAVNPGRAHLMDVYSFGAMAFEMLAARPPFTGETLVQLLEQHLQDAPPDLAVLRPDLPRPLSTMITSCMAKDPWGRPSDMESIVWELRSLWRRQVDGSGPIRTVSGPAQAARETYRKTGERKRVELPAGAVGEVLDQVAAPVVASPTPADILIVEDDPEVRDALACVLNESGYRTLVAADGRDALELMRRLQWRPAMILLDLMMPVMDGQEFLESQARDPGLGEIPVVVVTAQPVKAQPAERARQFLSVRGVLPKPLELPSLLELIHDVCHQKRQSPTV